MANEGMSVKGLAGAQAMLQDLEKITGVEGGAALFYPGGERRPNIGQKTAPTYEELLGYLAEGGRDIRPNEEDVNKMAELAMQKVSKQLAKVGREYKDKKTGETKVVRKEKQSLAGFVSGLNASMMEARKIMADRIKSGKTSSGTAEKVTEAYAKRRNTLYGVNESVVYVASGQLSNAMLGAKAKVDIKSK